MMRKIFRKQIKALKFTLLSPEQIKKLSSVKVVTPELYDIDGFPVDGGLMDLRLGAIDPGVRCRTCGKRVKECPGHPGSIELARPILHIKYIPLIVPQHNLVLGLRYEIRRAYRYLTATARGINNKSGHCVTRGVAA